MARFIALRSEFVTLTGSMDAALFLSQCVYWSPRGKNGWFYKTQQDWESELGLKRRRVDRVRRQLKALGVLEEQRRGIPCKVYYRIDLVKLKTLSVQASVSRKDKPVCTLCTNCDVHNVQTITEITHRLQTESKTGDSSSTLAKAEEHPDNHQEDGEEKEKEDKKEMTLAKEILETMKKKSISLYLPSNWQAAMAEHTGGFQKPLSMKEIGQLKKYGQYTGDHAIPALKWAVHNWWKFAQQTKVEKGLDSVPTDPTIGFLLKYCDVAVNGYLQSIAQNDATVVDNNSPKSSLIAAPQVAIPAEKEEDVYKPSADTVASLMEELKGE